MRTALVMLVTLCCACAPEERSANDIANIANAKSQQPTISTVENTNSAPESKSVASYVGSEGCKECHEAQFAAWQTSDHWHAMQKVDVGAATRLDVAMEFSGRTTQFTELGNGEVTLTTDDVAQGTASFPVAYAFGVSPLQQFLIDVGDGKLQATSVAWDSRPATQGGQRWFHLREDEVIAPDDVLHWTQPGLNWNYMCADCHSTAVSKNYDVATRTYDTSWEEITVGCEACHGPASEHLQSPQAALPVSLAGQAEQVNSCAPCHSRRAQLAESFTAGLNYFDHYSPSLLEQGLYHADGQIRDEVYVYGSFLQSKMYDKGVTCSDCHDPHSGQTRAPDNTLCTQCHSKTGRVDFPTLALKQYDSPEHHFHSTDSNGARCVSCHMTEETYMVVDPRRDHSFRIPRPDLSESLGVPNACNGCHQDEDTDWAVDQLTQRFGAPQPHYGSILASARSADPLAEQALADLANDLDKPGIVRGTAMMLAAGYSRRMTSTAIAAGLEDPDPIVRVGALRGAQRWALEQRWRQVSRLLRDDVLAVRVEATRVLMPLMQGLEPRQQQVLDAAMDEYLTVVSLNSDRAEGQTNMAMVYLAKGDIVAAQEALQEALLLNPQWVPAMVNLADLYRASGRDHLGGALLENAVRLVPENSDALLARALWLVRQNQTDQALPLLKAAWELSEQSRFAYVYAVALNGVGDPQAALAVLDSALARRADRQLLETALSIARDAGLLVKAARYAAQIEGV